MKSQRKSNIFKTRLISFAVCAALIICSALSILFYPESVLPKAAGETTGPYGIRFTQVAAGEDFAIGLTADGKLYGWSLRADRASATGNEAAATTLGGYYTGTPTQIDVRFRKGPGTGSAASQVWGDNDYHTATTDDGIYQIAATRYTAAFVSKKGFIYTWGKDVNDIEYDSIANAWKLLLREEERSGSGAADDPGAKWYLPYIVNYDYYGNNENSDALKFTRSTVNVTNVSLAGGEYNYIYTFPNSGSVYSFVWGSLSYAVSNQVPYESYAMRGTGTNSLTNDRTNNRLVYAFASNDSSSNVTLAALAGGHTVGYVLADGTVSLRGKNFLNTGVAAGEGENTYIVEQTVKTDDGAAAPYSSVISDNGNTYKGAIIGAVGGDNTYDYGQNRRYEIVMKTSDDNQIKYADRYYSAISGKYKNVTTVNARDKYNGEIASGATAMLLNGVSLGNDVGYAVNSDGKLLFWGDNSSGQGASLAGNIDVPTEIPVSGASAFVSVAAGKQLSAKSLPFNIDGSLVAVPPASGGETEGGENGEEEAEVQPQAFTDAYTHTFIDSLKHEAAFISGALDSSGNLYVWSDKDRAVAKIDYCGKDGQYAAVYSGYGNNIFAVTKQGKLVHIAYATDGYAVKAFDAFRDISGKAVENWSVAKYDEENKIKTLHFAATANYGTAVIYAESLTAPDSVDKKDFGAETLIALNNSGDTFRIVNPDADKDKLFYGSQNNRGAKVELADLKIEFTYNGEIMTEKQIANMFRWEFKYDSVESGSIGRVGIEITPYQSTKGLPVEVSFAVARYNNGTEFTSRDSDTAVYYDVQRVSFAFTVENTSATMRFKSFESDTANSTIPLLDPNNKYNKFYSIAVQDVSTGITELAKHLGDEALAAAMLAEIKENDPGFPAAEKIELGHLEYYLGSEAAGTRDREGAYTGKYKYLFSDRDSDLVKIASSGGFSLLAGNNNAVKNSVQKITVEVAIPEAIASSVQAMFDGTAGKRVFDKEFDNKYGLYDIGLTDEGIRFSYDVVCFEAVGSTGKIQYVGEDDEGQANTASPSQYITNKNAAEELGLANTYYLKTYEFRTLNGGNFTPYIPGSIDEGAENNPFDIGIWGETDDNSLNVFSQPSLRIQTMLLGGKNTAVDLYGKNDAGEATGDNGYSGNKITVNYREDGYDGMQAAQVGGTITINLSSFVPVSTGMYFSFNDKGQSSTEYEKFNKQFIDETGNGIPVVTLTATSITVKPTTTANLTFTVAIQRFYGTNNQVFGAENEPKDEKIYITFYFPAFRAVTLGMVTGASTSFNVAQESTIDLFGGEDVLNAGNALIETNTAKENVKMLDGSLQSSDVGVLTVSKKSDTEIVVTPVASGTAVVQFILSAYGNSMVVSLDFNVSGVTTVNDDINLIDTHYQYINVLTNKLKTANSFVDNIGDYQILQDDTEHAYYFTDAEGNVLDAPPTFVENVRFVDLETNPMVRIESNAEVLENSSDIFYLHLRFAPKNETISYTTYDEMAENNIPVLETRQKITSIKKIVPGDPDYLNPYYEIVDSIFTVWLDVDNVPEGHDSSESSSWYVDGKNKEAKLIVKVRYLLKNVTDDPDRYEVFRVSVSSADSRYFKTSFDAGTGQVIIQPISNTPKSSPDQYGNDALTVTVACKPTSSTSNQSNIILAFRVSIDGISTTLPKDEYVTIWLVAFFSSFGFLFIIFIIRMVLYWKRRGKQRALIKRNQELIKMRDRIHNKATAATREQVVKTKLKMEDPKYAKMFNDMRKDKENETGITLENSDLAALADDKSKKKKKKKGGKKSIAELKAELEAKKAAIAQAQTAAPVNPFETPIDPSFGGDPAFGGEAPFAQEGGFDNPIGGETIVFDAPDSDEGV